MKNTSLSQTCHDMIIEQYTNTTSETPICVWWKNLSKILPHRYFLIPGNLPRGWLDICQTPCCIWFFESRQRCTLFQHSELNETKLFKMHPHDISKKVSSCKIFSRAFFIRSSPKLLNGFQNMTIVKKFHISIIFALQLPVPTYSTITTETVLHQTLT